MKWIGSSRPGTQLSYARLAAARTVTLLAAGALGACMNGGTLTDKQCNDLVQTDCDKANPNVGGAGGGGGMAGASGSANCDAEKLRAATLTNCAAFENVTVFETDFLKARCGNTTACHKAGSLFPPALSGMDIWKGIAKKRNTRKTALCKDDDWANVDDPALSHILGKTRDAAPVCPSDNTKEAGAQMPSGKADPLLTAEELECLTAYLTAIADNCE